MRAATRQGAIMDAAGQVKASAGWTTRVVPLLLAVWAAGLVLTLFALRHTDWRGDEYTYTAGARAIAMLLAGGTNDAGAVWREVIGTGWFMPGIELVLAPAFVFDPQPPFWVVRGWMGLVNAMLSAFAVLALIPLTGRKWIAAALVFPACAPLWHVAALSVLPDLPAGLLLVIALAYAVRLAKAMAADEALVLRHLVLMELALVAALYLRGPVLLPALTIHALLCVLALVWRPKAVRPVLAGMVAFAAALAPWSIAASRHFGEPVLTTTNVPLVLADSFGDPATNCFGPCPPGDDIWPAWHSARDVAMITGRNPLAVEREIRDRALARLTVRDYLARVRAHFGSFVLDPGGSLRTFLPVTYAVPKPYRQPWYAVMLGATLLLYVPFMAALALSNLVVFRRNGARRVQSLFVKLATACLCLQPFVHKASARYWVALAPLAAWAVILLMKEWRARAVGTMPEDVVPRWVGWAETAWSVTLVALAAAILAA